jgi:PAS domain S-box-containing protein
MSADRLTRPLQTDSSDEAAGEVARDHSLQQLQAELAEHKKLVLAHQRLAAIVESSDDAIISKDLDGIITSWNRAAETIFGYSAEEIVGQPITILIPPERYAEEATIISRIRRGERTNHFETIRKHRSGRLIHVAVTVSPLRDASGNVVGASKIARDITERKGAEQQQQCVYDLVARVNRAEAMPEIMEASLDAIRRCVRADRAAVLLFDEQNVMRFKAWFGLSDGYRAAVEGHSPWAINASDPRPIYFEDVSRAPIPEALRETVLKEGIGAIGFIPLTYEKRLLGKFMIYFNEPRPISVEDLRASETIASQVSFAIIRQQSEQALEKLVAERTASLREAVGQMEEFSYTVSHDLRSPLRAMHGYANTLLEDFGNSLPAEALEYLQRIKRSSTRMDRLIQDLLVYSRLAQREFPIIPLSLDKLVQDIIDQTSELQPSRAQVTVKRPLLNVLGHESSLAQVIVNLLGNAVKFVRAGEKPNVQVWTEREGDVVRLWVEDNGIGIKPEYHHRLFGLFERIHPEPLYEGTGMGLAIVRKAVERMGGKVGVESDGEHGSRFWVELPAATET